VVQEEVGKSELRIHIKSYRNLGEPYNADTENESNTEDKRKNKQNSIL
jgi:hypothetical protein